MGHQQLTNLCNWIDSNIPAHWIISRNIDGEVRHVTSKYLTVDCIKTNAVTHIIIQNISIPFRNTCWQHLHDSKFCLAKLNLRCTAFFNVVKFNSAGRQYPCRFLLGKKVGRKAIMTVCCIYFSHNLFSFSHFLDLLFWKCLKIQTDFSKINLPQKTFPCLSQIQCMLKR